MADDIAQEAASYRIIISTSLGLTVQERRLLAFLFISSRPSKAQIMDHLYRSVGDREPEVKIVDVMICKMRRKLKPLCVDIQTHWGRGYYLENADRERIDNLVSRDMLPA